MLVRTAASYMIHDFLKIAIFFFWGGGGGGGGGDVKFNTEDNFILVTTKNN